MRPLLLTLAVALTPLVAHAEEPIVPSPPAHLLARGAVWAASPLALESGMVLGATGSLQRRVGTAPLLYGLRLGAGRTSEANRSWSFDHTHLLAAASFGADRMLGGARLWAQVEVGALLVLETLERQQAQRLEKLGFDTQQSGWSLGPHAAIELGAALPLRGGWSLHVAGGPTVASERVEAKTLVRFGVQSELGVGHAF